MNFWGLARACVMICRSGSGLWINGKPNAFFIEHTSHEFDCIWLRLPAFWLLFYFPVFCFFLFFVFSMEIYVVAICHAPSFQLSVFSSVNYLSDCSNYENIPTVIQIFGHRCQRLFPQNVSHTPHSECYLKFQSRSILS